MKPMLYMRLVVDVFDRCISRKHSLSMIEVLLGAIPDSRAGASRGASALLGLGAINTTFGEDLPASFAEYIPAVPMVALAVAEFGRVPLSSVIYHKHK
jgi:hypothetical protein